MSTPTHAPAARLLIYAGYNPPPVDDEAWELLERIKPTHVAVGLNSPVVADRQSVWRRMGWVDSRGEEVAQKVHDLGAVLVLWSWLVADERFVLEAAQDHAALGKRWGAGADLPNPELPWVGSADPVPLVTKRGRSAGEIAQRAAVVRRSHKADHERQAKTFYAKRAELGRGHIPCWPAVSSWIPRAVRPLIEGGTGVISQMQSVGGKTDPPPGRQDTAWALIDQRRLRKPAADNWLVWSQVAPHDPPKGVPVGQWVTAQCDAALANAQRLEEANIAAFDLPQIQQHPETVEALRAYSPRGHDPNPRWTP